MFTVLSPIFHNTPSVKFDFKYIHLQWRIEKLAMGGGGFACVRDGLPVLKPNLKYTLLYNKFGLFSMSKGPKRNVFLLAQTPFHRSLPLSPKLMSPEYKFIYISP